MQNPELFTIAHLKLIDLAEAEMAAIDRFFQTPFSRLALAEKLEIKRLGPPTPALKIKQKHGRKDKEGKEVEGRYTLAAQFNQGSVQNFVLKSDSGLVG